NAAITCNVISAPSHQFLDCLRVVVDCIAIDDGGARLIEPHQLHLGAFTAELDDHPIQGLHGGDVPEVGAGQIDCDLFHGLLEVEGTAEALRRSEENLAHHRVDA